MAVRLKKIQSMALYDVTYVGPSPGFAEAPAKKGYSQFWVNGTGSTARLANAYYEHAGVATEVLGDQLNFFDDQLNVDGFNFVAAYNRIKGIIIENLDTTSGHYLIVSGSLIDALFGGTGEAWHIGAGGIMWKRSPSGTAINAGSKSVVVQSAGAWESNYRLWLIPTRLSDPVVILP